MRVLLALPDPAEEGAVLRRLGRADAGVTVLRRCVDLADLLAAGATAGADAVVVSAGLRNLDRDAVLTLHRQGLRVVLVTAAGTASADGSAGGGADGRWLLLGAEAVASDPESVLAALRLPARLPETEPFAVAGPEAGSGAGRPVGSLVAVWGPAGAPGRTTVAVTVADECARLGVPALLVDADTHGPSVAVRLGLLDDVSGLAAASRTAASGRLDPASLVRSAVVLDAGLQVLTGLPRPDRWSELRPAALDAVWSACRGAATVTVVDVAAGLERPPEAEFDPTVPVRDGAALAALAAADTVLCVGRLDPVGLVRLVRDLPRVREVAPTAALVGVVVPTARARASDVASARQVLAERAGLHDLVVVPDDRSAVEAAHWSATTLAESAPGSAARAALADLAARLAGVAPRRARRGRTTARARLRRPA